MTTRQQSLTIVANFRRDLAGFQKGVLAAAGFQLPASFSDHEVSCLYFDFRSRLVVGRPRKVHIAAELVCPPGHAHGFESLRAKIERGDDLSPHLSRQLSPTRAKKPQPSPEMLPAGQQRRLRDKDGLFNHWGLHHLHVGTGADARDPSLVDGAEEVVFAFFQPDDAYLIGFYGHDDWYNPEPLQRLCDNWPAIFGAGQITTFSEEAVEDLRNIGIMTVPLRDGEAFFLPGVVGYTNMGVNQQALMRTNRLVTWLCRLEKTLKEELFTFATDRGQTLPEEVALSLRIDSSFEAYIDVAGTDWHIALGQLPFH